MANLNGVAADLKNRAEMVVQFASQEGKAFSEMSEEEKREIMKKVDAQQTLVAAGLFGRLQEMLSNLSFLQNVKIPEAFKPSLTTVAEAKTGAMVIPEFTSVLDYLKSLFQSLQTTVSEFFKLATQAGKLLDTLDKLNDAEKELIQKVKENNKNVLDKVAKEINDDLNKDSDPSQRLFNEQDIKLLLATDKGTEYLDEPPTYKEVMSEQSTPPNYEESKEAVREAIVAANPKLANAADVVSDVLVRKGIRPEVAAKHTKEIDELARALKKAPKFAAQGIKKNADLLGELQENHKKKGILIEKLVENQNKANEILIQLLGALNDISTIVTQSSANDATNSPITQTYVIQTQDTYNKINAINNGISGRITEFMSRVPGSDDTEQAVSFLTKVLPGLAERIEQGDTRVTMERRSFGPNH